MPKHCVIIVFLLCSYALQSQSISKDTSVVANDSIKKIEFLKQLGNGYLPTKYVKIDLRYLVKYNQYEGLRTGLGGVTSDDFSRRYRLNGYVVYGFRDHHFKYSLTGAIKIAEPTNTWLSLSYTDDLQESGSSSFLTDKRFFSFFEPRLLNIDLFHRHITKAISLEHQFTNKLLSEVRFAVSNVTPTYEYGYVHKDRVFTEFHLSTAKFALQWSPFSEFELTKNGIIETEKGYPKFTLQYTKNFENVFKSDVDFSKIDFRTIYQIQHKNKTVTEATVTGGLTNGNTPLTHMYHAYPNNIRKESILQRFSIAGLNSFETMFFNEFFSDRFTTLQLKHNFNPINVSLRFKPELVLITRFAIGNMNEVERHQGISFGTLNRGYTESGLEINKLLFGFGLSFAYRYGGYHLPNFEDNIALKFTFKVSF